MFQLRENILLLVATSKARLEKTQARMSTVRGEYFIWLKTSYRSQLKKIIDNFFH